MLLFVGGNIMASEDGKYYWLLEEVSWSFAQEKSADINAFYDSLEIYNKDIEVELPDYIGAGLGFNEVIIKYSYVELIDNNWTTVRNEIQLKSDYESFSELELLYQLHNNLQIHYMQQDKHYFEGLELQEDKKKLIYELMLGS